MNRQNVPQLRFNGFNGEWETCLLSDVTKYIKGYAFKSEDYQDNGVRIIRVSDLSSDSIKNDVEKVYINEIKSKIYDKYKLRKGNIVITTVGSKPEMLESAVGRGIFINNENEGLLNQNMLKFENIKNVDNGFIIGLINTKRYQHYMKSIARGNANQANITVVDLLQYEIALPTLPEQQKIASFLSAVDEKIQQLSRKKELLSQYKKGVMQQLFSGKLRFKDENGDDYADWEEKRLGEVGSIISGLTYSPDDIDENGILVLRSSNVQNRRLSFQDNVYVKTSAFNPVKLNDILICVRNGSKHLIGKNAIIDKETAGVAFGAFMSVYRSKYNLYIFHYFDTDEYKNEVHKNLGATINSINGSDLKKFKIPFPCFEEQQKIANFLSSIDAKIESTSQQITKTQSFKKGLLQQLFV